MGERKYSVFLSNVGSCSDRYCPAYDRPFGYSELFDRAKSIDLLSGVDLVLTKDALENKGEILESIARTGLAVVSVAVDHFTDPLYKQGSFSSVDASVRTKAVRDTERAMDFAAELGCPLVTIWPGQDGYDYLFQADYIQERRWFTDGVRAACAYRRDVTVTLEYKLKEPRTHCYVSGVGTALLMIADCGAENLGVAFDYGHAALGYETPGESVALLSMYGDKLRHVHINDNFAQWDDDMIVGTVHTLHFLEFFYWLRKTGYRGYLTIDQFPYREDGREAVAESARWLDALEGAAERIDPAEIAAVLGRKDAVASSRLMRSMLFGR